MALKGRQYYSNNHTYEEANGSKWIVKKNAGLGEYVTGGCDGAGECCWEVFLWK